MAWNKLKPDGSDQFNVSDNDIRANWDALDTHNHSAVPGATVVTGGITDGAITNIKFNTEIQRYNYILNPSFDWFNYDAGSGTWTNPDDNKEVFWKWYSRKSGATPPSFTVTTETTTPLKKSGNVNYGQSSKVDITVAGLTAPRQYLEQTVFNAFAMATTGYVNAFAWVYCVTASKIKLAISNSVGNVWYSSYHGGTGWERLAVQGTVGASSSRDLVVQVGVIDADTAILTYYVDDVGFYVGSNISTPGVSYCQSRYDLDNLLLMMGSSDGGSFAPRYKYKKVTAAYTLTPDDFILLVDDSAGAVTITLPYYGNKSGKCYIIKKIVSSANNLTIDGYSTETIEDTGTDSQTYILHGKNEWVVLFANDTGTGANWLVIGGNTVVYGGAIRATAYSIAAVNTWYDLPLNGGDLPTKNVTHSTVTNPERITIRIPGTYTITYTIHIRDVASTPFQVNARLAVNGAEIYGSGAAGGITGTSQQDSITKQIKYKFATVGDYVTIQIGANTTGAVIDIYDDANLPNFGTIVVASMEVEKE